MTPYEIICGPLTLYLAPVGTAFPAIDAAPAVDWIKVGASGDADYSDDGVKVTHTQSNQLVRPGGTVGPVKAFRESEDLTIGVTIWDLTLEMYMYGLNGNTVAATAAGAGTAGFKKIGLSRGKSIKTYALLVRGKAASAYSDVMAAQYEVPRCFQSANPTPLWKKGVPVGLDLEFTALEDPGASSDAERFGRLLMQHQAALGG